MIVRRRYDVAQDPRTSIFTDERDCRVSHERDRRMIASMCDMSLHVVDTCWVLSLVAAEENM